MKSICVFCGSSQSNDEQFVQTAKDLGRRIAERNIRLVYGGAKVGLMGVVADAVLEAGGSVTGVLPRFLRTKEIAHAGLTEIIFCDTMHERKMRMFELAEGFVALPGGFGTLEEVFEMLTWQQLGLHRFPIAFLNINNFYEPLVQLIQNMEKKELLKSHLKKMAIFASNSEDLFQLMQGYEAPEVPKWINEQTT